MAVPPVGDRQPAEETTVVVRSRTSNRTWSAPVQLVKYGQKLEVVEEGRRALEALGQQQVAVTTVCGLYRTGKSFLINALCNRIGRGFQVGNTVRACTEGIWLSISKDESVAEVMLDVEGSGNTQNHAEHDIVLFSLAVLISSTFVYNSKGVIDEQAIGKLSMVTSLASHIDPDELDSPRFVWVLRDFWLAKEHNGKAISSAEYMELQLSDKQAAAWRHADSKEAREKLVRFFRLRDCVTMVQPVQDEGQLQDLDRIESTQALRPEFRDELAELQRKLFDGRAKSVRRVPLSAAAFAGLLDRYAAAFNEGKHPRIISCWDAVQHEETSRVLEECKAQLAVKAREIEAGLPLEDDELAKATSLMRSAAEAFFRESALGEPAVISEYAVQLSEEASTVVKRLEQSNARVGQQACETACRELWRPVEALAKAGAEQAALDAAVVEMKGKYAEVCAPSEVRANVLVAFLPDRLQAAVAAATEVRNAALREKETAELRAAAAASEEKRQAEASQAVSEKLAEMQRAADEKDRERAAEREREMRKLDELKTKAVQSEADATAALQEVKLQLEEIQRAKAAENGKQKACCAIL
jgi:hypothetical protein